MPVTLDVTEKSAGHARDQCGALRRPEGVMPAFLTAQGVFWPDKQALRRGRHQGRHAGRVCLGGPVEGVTRPVHHDNGDRRRAAATLHEGTQRRCCAGTEHGVWHVQRGPPAVSGSPPVTLPG